MDLRTHIPVVPDWPKPGVNFLDITGLLTHAPAFNHAVDQLIGWIRHNQATSIVAVESRGFIFGAPVANALKLPLVLARKPNKLPGPVHTVSYTTEYSFDSLAIKSSSEVGGRPCVIDDVIATGGTVLAVTELLERHWHPQQVLAAAVIALDFLPGMSALQTKSIRAHALIHYG